MTYEPKEGAPPCGISIRVSAADRLEDVLQPLRQVFFALNSSEYEKNMHVLEIPLEPGASEKVQENAGNLIALAKQNGVVSILNGEHEIAAELEADGVLLNNPEFISAARTIFMGEGIVGLRCGGDRAKAAFALDIGVDYVTFSGTGQGYGLPDPGLIAWWATMTEKPCLAEGPITNDYAAHYVQAGAGFLDSSDYIWTHEKGPMQATVNMLYAIDLALEELKVQ